VSNPDSHYNPCLIGRKPWLARLGDGLAAFFIRWFEEPTGGCPCCIAIRILTLTAGALATGLAIGVFL
jgi:hypothetical protein